MARLTAAQRRSMSQSEYAGPNKTYPVNDKVHQIKAEEFATKNENAGRLTPQAASRIRAKAQRLLAKGNC